MTRLFFAFLALLSGLAAVQAPAHAARAEPLAYGVQSASHTSGAPMVVASKVATAVDGFPHPHADEAASANASPLRPPAAGARIGIDKALE